MGITVGRPTLRHLKPEVELAEGGVMDGRAAHSTERPTERLADWVVASALLVFALPLMVLVAIAIKCDSPGPILVHPRCFAAGRQYIALKFRSTPRDNPSGRPTTPVGRFLRYTRIENLPQLVNVFRGEMSCVSPRPRCPFFLD
jgi:lipopolysaccharide/colanic/teichoic acid biosynthesis glycosyltransferase